MNVTPMGSTADGISFMVQRLGTEVGPYKQYRELIVNAIEAIEARQKGFPNERLQGQMEVGPDRYWQQREGMRKISVADNGIGMDAYELRTYFNTLALTGKIQSIDANFGVGAKIATAAWNPYGVEIRSWKNGIGHMIRLVYDPENKHYGLEQVSNGDEYLECVPLNELEDGEKMKPDFITEHGTVVVLLGKSHDDDTTVAPETSDLPKPNQAWWFHRIANKQFFRIPDGIKFSSKVETRTDGIPNTRSIQGYEPVVKEFAISKGITHLSDADVHWYILDEKRSAELNNRRHSYHAFSGTKKHGHVAAIFGYEMYDFASHDAAIPTLQKFGVFAGYNHVVLYVDPKPALRVTANLTRTRLVLPDGSYLPWDRWANEFFQNIPEAIAKHVEAHQNLGSKSEDDFVNEQIKKYRDLLQLRSRHAVEGGADRSETSDNYEDESDFPTEQSTRQRTAAKRGPRRPAMQFKAGDQQATEDVPLELRIKRQWVKEKEAGLEERAARFIPERSLLEINEDFSILADLAQHGLDLIAHDRRPIHVARIEEQARKLYATQLTWTVMSAMATFKNREGWRGEGFHKLIEPESLTAAILPRYHMLDEMKNFVKKNPFTKRDLLEVTPEEEVA